jgi:hypothetical protein
MRTPNGQPTDRTRAALGSAEPERSRAGLPGAAPIGGQDAFEHDALEHDAPEHDALDHDALDHDALDHDPTLITEGPDASDEEPTAVHGNLERTPLAHVLLTAYWRKASGTLLIGSNGDPGRESRLWLQHGIPRAGVLPQGVDHTLLDSMAGLLDSREVYGFQPGRDLVHLAGQHVVDEHVDPLAVVGRLAVDPARPDAVQRIIERIDGRALLLRADAPLHRLGLPPSAHAIASELACRPRRVDELTADAPAARPCIEQLCYVLCITKAVELVRLPDPEAVRDDEGDDEPTDRVSLRTVASLARAQSTGDTSNHQANPIFTLPPGVPAAPPELGELRHAQAMARRGDWDRAMSHLRRALTLAPRSSEAHAELGWTLFRQHRGNLDESTLHDVRCELDRALELNPNNVDAHYYLGVILKHAGRPRESLAEFEYVLWLDPYHVDAARELHLAQRRKSRPPSLLRRLFGSS